jgi:GNAT superfamily N-acetyltransferase
MKIRLQSTFWTVLSRFTKPFLSAYYVFEADLSRQRPALPAKPGFFVRLYRGGADLQAAIDVLVPAGLGAADISARLKRGDLVAVGVIGDRLVAYTWASFTEARVKELGMKLCARADEVIQYDTLVLKPFRRHGLQFAVAEPVLDYAQQHGYARTLSWVNVLNRASCKNQRRWGKKVLLTAILLEIPGTQHRWTFSLGAPLDSVFSRVADPNC